MTLSPAPLPETSTAELVADRIRSAILDGQLRPGDRIIESDLADQFMISRGPVREAIRLLVPEGLLVVRRNRGAVVASPTFDDVMEVYAVRMSLGALALTQAVHIDAAKRPGFGSVKKGLDLLRLPSTQGDPIAMMEADLHFQGMLLSLSELPRIIDMLSRSARDAASFVRMLGITYNPGDYSDLISRHERTISALEAGSSTDVVAAWQLHIRTTIGEFARGYPGADLTGVFSHPLTHHVLDQATTRESRTP